MDDLYPSEPLNLVKKKKPIAVVAPSSVNEEKSSSASAAEPDPSAAVLASFVATAVHAPLEKSSDTSNEDEDVAAKLLTPVDRSASPSSQHSALKNGYPSLLAAAPYDPTFLTNLYVNSLMTAGYLNNNYPYNCYSYGGLGSAATSLSSPSSSSSSASALIPAQPPPPPPPHFNGNSLSSLWAQQRFWQMVNWHEARCKAELVSSVSSKSLEESLIECSSSVYKAKTNDILRLGSPVHTGGESLNASATAAGNETELLSNGRSSTAKKLSAKHKLKKLNHR